MVLLGLGRRGRDVWGWYVDPLNLRGRLWAGLSWAGEGGGYGGELGNEAAATIGDTGDTQCYALAPRRRRQVVASHEMKRAEL